MANLTHEEIQRLTPAERLHLIGDLWDSLSADDALLPDQQAAELVHRLDTFVADRAQAVSWDDLKADLLKRS